MRTIKLNLNHLRAVSLFAAVKDIRSYLNGVCVEVTPHAVRLCATNGHVLAVTNTAHDEGEPRPDCGQWIIPSDAIKAGIKCVGKHLSVILLNVPDDDSRDGCTLGIPGNAVMFNAIDGRFPDYRRVVPSTIDGTPAQYNPTYLYTFQQAALVYGGRNANGYIMLGMNGQGSARVHINESEFIGVIMPWRTAQECPELPGWWTEQAPEQITEPEALAA